MENKPVNQLYLSVLHIELKSIVVLIRSVRTFVIKKVWFSVIIINDRPITNVLFNKWNSTNVFQTPLHLAVELEFVDAVKTLLQAGANPNLVNKRGENSIHLAVKLDLVHCLETIISNSRHNSDLNTRNFEGKNNISYN